MIQKFKWVVLMGPAGNRKMKQSAAEYDSRQEAVDALPKRYELNIPWIITKHRDVYGGDSWGRWKDNVHQWITWEYQKIESSI